MICQRTTLSLKGIFQVYLIIVFAIVSGGNWLAGCPKLLAAETKLDYHKITFAVTWVYQNENFSEELIRIYYFICRNEL